MRNLVMVIAVVLLEALAGASDDSEAANARNHVSAAGRTWVQQGINRALRELDKPECQKLFSDFSDASGVPLSTKLHDMGVTPGRYLTNWIWFVDGSAQNHCRLNDTAAFTEPGSRVIFVCSARVASQFLPHAPHGEIVILHELLHTLGLGENPPTTSEITKQVMARCGN